MSPTTAHVSIPDAVTARDFAPISVLETEDFIPVLLRFQGALTALDAVTPAALGRCRVAALRYAEFLERQRIGPRSALRFLRAAAGAWAPPRLTAAERLRLHAGLRFWVGTAYGLRWRTAADAAVGPPDPTRAPR